MKAEFFGQAGWPPPSQARPTRRSSTVPISSPWLDQWLARRRVDQQGEAVRLTSCTYLGVLSAEWSLGGQGDQESRPAMRLTEPATITTPEHIRQEGVGEHGAPDPRVTHSGVRHLVAHADGEGDIGEVAVGRRLLPSGSQKAIPASLER
jgi:hypothetical protein